jgi:hypothetical protein
MASFLDIVKNYPNQVSAFVAFCALFISLLSIILTLLSLLLQQRHNYKSLTPIANISISDYENTIAVKLENTGVGPLIVDDFVVSKGSENRKSIISWMPKTPKGMYWDTFYDNLEGRCIPQNTEVVLIKLSGKLEDHAFVSFRDIVRRSLCELQVAVEYRDIYKRLMPKKERDLKWFGRHFNE